MAADRNVSQEVTRLRSQGLTDSMIMDELVKNGYDADQIHQAISSMDADSYGMEDYPASPAAPQSYAAAAPEEGNIYERIEEITENMIDEKWDALINEVRKVIEWKDKIEEKQQRMQMIMDKLQEDFNVLHQGVLGKLDDYDSRMQEVGTELKAVGKVFKDVVPQFVENVKELSSYTEEMKKKK